MTMTQHQTNDPAAWMSSRRSCALALAAIAALTITAYLPAFGAGMIWDDDVHIAKKSLHSMHGLWKIWSDPAATQQYYPLAHTGFWIQYMLWGERPAGYHAVNVLLHVINVLLFWRVLQRLAVPGALFATALFAVHPVHVESVAWISELKNTLMATFYLSAALAYFRFNPWEDSDSGSGVVAADRRRVSRWYILAAVLYLAALLSKTVAATLPPALLVIVWWKRGRISGRRDVAPLMPFFIVGAAMGLFVMWLEQHLWGSKPENVAGEAFDWTWLERVLIAGRAVWFYAWKLLWPHELTFFYPRWDIDASQWWQYLFPIAAIALVLALWLLRRRIGRGPLAAILLFGGTLMPALGFFNLFWQLYTLVCDHMQYVASMSILALIGAGADRLIRRLPPKARFLGLAACGAVIIALTGLSWKQAGIYDNLESLYRDTIAKSPDSWLSHYNLAIVMADQGRADEAEALYRRAIEIRPNYADACYNLGNVLYGQQRMAEAIEQYQATINMRPQLVGAYLNLGNALYELNRIDDAAIAYEQALVIDPKFEACYDALGTMYANTDRLEEAFDNYQKGLAINPENAALRFNLGLLQIQGGATLQALVEFRQALQRNPKLASRVRALAYGMAREGRTRSAISCLELALDFATDDVAAGLDRERLSQWRSELVEQP